MPETSGRGLSVEWSPEEDVIQQALYTMGEPYGHYNPSSAEQNVADAEHILDALAAAGYAVTEGRVSSCGWCNHPEKTTCSCACHRTSGRGESRSFAYPAMRNPTVGQVVEMLQGFDQGQPFLAASDLFTEVQFSQVEDTHGGTFVCMAVLGKPTSALLTAPASIPSSKDTS